LAHTESDCGAGSDRQLSAEPDIERRSFEVAAGGMKEGRGRKQKAESRKQKAESRKQN
jgi:hypothetical protein